MRKKILYPYFFGFFACFICLLSSCGTGSKLRFKEKEVLPYTEEELNLILAIEFLKTNIYGCAPDCLIKVESTFEFFSFCHLEPLAEKTRKRLTAKKIKVPEGSYYIEGFGRVDFYNYLPLETPDWQFTPFNAKSNDGTTVLVMATRHKRGLHLPSIFDIQLGEMTTSEALFAFDWRHCGFISFDYEAKWIFKGETQNSNTQ
jgi:hypothetical protein